MGFVQDLAGLAGEKARIKRTANQESNLDAQTKQWLDSMRQNAQNGNIQAMYDLGCLYLEGKYIGYNPESACYWWTEAANRGHIDAQYNLGMLYHGDISKFYYDEALAGYWLSTAANNGDNEAYNFLMQHYKFSHFSNKWVRR